jgi:hypothetical protein
MSSAEFVDCPINTKLTDEVYLDSFNEAKFHSECEYRLTSNGTIELSEAKFLEFERVSDLEASFDGTSVSCYVTEYEGAKYYVVPSFNLTKVNEIKKFEMSFTYDITARPTFLVRTPLLFNENFAQRINFPLAIIQVQENNESDIATFRVHLDLPFRSIVAEQSGWEDAFVPPQSEWTLVDLGNNTYQYRYQLFEYPITQKYQLDGNTYSFTTHFSQQNVANTPSVTLVPDWKVSVLLLLFLSSPFYVPVFVWLQKRKNGSKSDGESRSVGRHIKKFFLMICMLYSILLSFEAMLSLYFFGFSGEVIPQMLLYIIEIMNPFLLVLVILYPMLFLFLYCRWKRKM